MIHTIHNPKLVDKYYAFQGKHRFTGVVKDKDNDIAYYLNGKRHRTDGPAVIYHHSSNYWYLNDELHRIDGPAIEGADGTKCWYLNGKRHREDGPAIEWYNGDKTWCLNGKKYGYNNDFTNESWIRFTKLQLLK